MIASFLATSSAVRIIGVITLKIDVVTTKPTAAASAVEPSARRAMPIGDTDREQQRQVAEQRVSRAADDCGDLVPAQALLTEQVWLAEPQQ